MSDEVVQTLVIEVWRHLEFDDFYRAHYLAVLRIAAAVTSDSEVAAEVAQEAFIAAHRRWRTISAYDRPDLWVRRVAINRALSWRRRVRNETRALARLARRRERPASDATVHGDVWSQVRRLPVRQASLIALVYIDDLSIEQAAHTLNIAVPTAKTHLQRARRTLATRLNEEPDHD